MKPREDVYTQKQVREVLGLASSQISRLLARGVISAVYEPGYAHHYYDKASVDNHKAEKEMFEAAHKVQGA